MHFQCIVVEFGLIFSHDFARAFWGNKPICTICGSDKFEGGKQYIPGEPDEYWEKCRGCGVEPIDTNEFGINDGTTLEAWQYHLQQMILKEDPLQYLSQSLND